MSILLRRIANCSSAIIGSAMKQSTKAINEPQFLGAKGDFTDVMKFINAESYSPIPIYRILKPKLNPKEINEKLDKDVLRKMYKDMLSVSIMDKILYESQRQGRISFYMTNSGEEAIQIGSSSALTPNDVIYAQYREAGVLLSRGFKFSQFMDQCYGNCDDNGKGRQMPVHYGCKELNFITISSPLTTQLPQAVGAAYALKRKKSNSCVICYFGEGAASEGDAHAALNFAASLNCPVIFLCRNNGYAISTPSHQQYKGDGIAAKGPAYGINTIRVDGNDVLAMYHVTQVARDYAIENGRPVLIEAMTYRVGHHSTSDDSTAYRSASEIAEWNNFSPIVRFRHFLEELGYWSQEDEISFTRTTKKDILKAFAEAEKKRKPNWKELFTDVYSNMPQHIKNQMMSMEEHVKKYSDHYPLEQYQNA